VTGGHRANSKQTLTTRELARFLKGLSSAFDERITGAPAVAESLLTLARVLSTLPDQPVSELKELNRPKQRTPKRRWDDAASLSLQEVRRLLRDENLLKSDLIELAHMRFKFPRARLEKLPIETVLETIWSAADNEDSLRVIAANAERAGKERGS
jgi:hypothetical protein